MGHDLVLMPGAMVALRITDDNYAGFEPLKGKAAGRTNATGVFSLGQVMKPMHEVRTSNLYRA